MIEVLLSGRLGGIPVVENPSEVAAGHEKRRQRFALANEGAFSLVDRYFEVSVTYCDHPTENRLSAS